MKVNLKSLFNYYLLSLKLENILSIKIRPSQVKDVSQIKLIDKIKDSFNASRKAKKYFKFKPPAPFDSYILIKLSSIEKDYKTCFDELSFLEKTYGYCDQVKKPLNERSLLETDPNFTYARQASYQYSIFFDLVEIGKGRRKDTVPLFILNFESQDVDNEFITADIVFEQIKKYMGKEYDRTIDERNLLKPVLLVNPSVIEDYNCPDLEFGYTNLDDLERNMHEYIKKYNVRSNNSIPFEDKIYLCAFPPKMTSGLERIYNQVLRSGANTLLNSYFSVHPNKITQVHVDRVDNKDIVTTASLIKSYTKHIGAFDSKYSLAETQRIAMSCFLNSHSSVLPVNGAPGTGKTSLLRCIFGQYVVESAIEAYDQYLNKKLVKFRTPIVCSSTNNQALTNIAHGVDSGFSDQIKNNPDNQLYKRWIEHIIDNSKMSYNDLSIDDNDLESEELPIIDELEDTKSNDKIDLSSQLFIPSIKNRPQNQTELNKADLVTILQNIKQHPEYYIECFHKYNPGHLNKKDDTHNQLLQIAEYFYQKIKNNNEVISKLDIVDGFFSDLANFEQYVLDKYTSQKYPLFEIQKSLSQIANNKNSWQSTIDDLDRLEAKIRDINVEIKQYGDKIAEVTTVFPEYIDKKATISEIISAIPVLSIHDYSVEKIKQLPQYTSEVNRIYIDNLSTETNKLKTEAERDLLLAKSFSSLIPKALNLLGVGRLSKTIKEIDQKLQQQLRAVQKKTLLETENTALELVKDKLNKTLTEIPHIKTSYNTKVESQKNLESALADLKKYCSDLLILEIVDIRKFLQLADQLDKAHQIKEEKAKLDVKERTDNFYYALHLLEALFFIEQSSSTGITCPWCKNISLYQPKDKPGLYLCRKCNAKYSKNNPNNPKLTDKEIAAVLKAKQYYIDGVRYQVECSQDKENNIWINIKRSNSINNQVDFNSLLPIFPMINLTCNSFGSVVANDENKIPEDLFDFLLIDEAGTILPSKMIILYCAKKCMLFGDAKQLKPIFNYSSETEYKLLNPYISNIDDKKVVNEYFSCASDEKFIDTANSAIHVANNCCQIILPYNASKLTGDIWLKEHYRCKDPIIEISNELTYENEIIPNAGKDGYLFFIESQGEKTLENINPTESQMIVDYIISQKDKLCKLLDEPPLSDEEYYKSISIITPFKNQEQYLIDLLEDNGLINNPKVGTVHKFQGSERRIIIFSTVYDSGVTENLFFNREDTSIINVAVTRAKDIFICFGREGLLNKPGTHSGLMVSKILANMDAYSWLAN